MSLEVGRVGVRPDQLDNYGRINPKSQFIQNLLNDLPVWTDLPVWKKGTEQLLPVNDDEPDTSPVLCDIEYPVADLKNNQYFTYRQSPTQKDGKAKIRGIRGKTLVWNQLTQYGDFASKTGYSAGGGTFAVASNEGTLTLTGSNSYLYRSLAFTTGHKVLVKVDAKTSNANGVTINVTYPYGGTAQALTTSYATYCYLGVVDESKKAYLQLTIKDGVNEQTVTFKNFMAFDLTTMFGAGNEPAIVDEFKALFPLPYYKYNTGSLLDFTGTKLKTTGRNLLNKLGSRQSNGITFTYDSDTGGIKCKGTATANAYNSGSASTSSANTYTILPAGTYKLTLDGTLNANHYPRGYFQPVYLDGTVGDAVAYYNETTVTLDRPAYAYMRIQVGNGEVVDTTVYPMIRFSDVSKGFEPYEENEDELPISTFFPTGMKSAGAVYDELTPTRAITRVGSITIDGTEGWVASEMYTNRFAHTFATIDTPSSNYLNRLTNEFKVTQWANNSYEVALRNTGVCYICLDTTASQMTVEQFTTYMTAHPLTINYELAVEDVQPTMSFGD